MYEIREHKKQYINQDDATMIVSFQLPFQDWKVLRETESWREVERLLHGMRERR